ncbi:YaaC family protein [Kitasatospora sp. NPDC101801]|uniref:YaaC family protein n=1 Tax=Kitasatospora sp. NPDC101801 TaxID=3364103 RepID=UPI0037F9AD87
MTSGRTTDSATAWADLRATRHTPPGYAAKGGRSAVYIAGLEQAEQLFAAAAHAGYATRPLLAFYGLSQAGRALAATAPAPPGLGWKLTSHGLKAPVLSGPLPDLPIVQIDKDGGSFTRLSALLNSPPIPSDMAKPLILGDLWELIPEAQTRPLRGTRTIAPLLPLLPDDRNWSSADRPTVGAFIAEVPDSVTGLAVPGRTLEDLFSPELEPVKVALDSFMADYPHAANYSSAWHRGREQAAFGFLQDRFKIRLEWPVDEATAAACTAKIASVATGYDGRLYLMPAVAGNDRPLHPLMVWWLVLYSLSMLARYEPAGWGEHIDVDRSAHAVALEHMLDVALTAVPKLIHSALLELA